MRKDIIKMYKRLKILINNIKELFSIEFLDKLSKKTGFVKRKSKLNAEIFLALSLLFQVRIYVINHYQRYVEG